MRTWQLACTADDLTQTQALPGLKASSHTGSLLLILLVMDHQGGGHLPGQPTARCETLCLCTYLPLINRPRSAYISNSSVNAMLHVILVCLFFLYSGSISMWTMAYCTTWMWVGVVRWFQLVAHTSQGEARVWTVSRAPGLQLGPNRMQEGAECTTWHWLRQPLQLLFSPAISCSLCLPSSCSCLQL